jgi:hypothetical protein
VFPAGEVSVDVVLASACLPLIHHAIEIDGEPYWDGGYSANPPLIPLVLASRAAHLLIVQVTPTKSDRLPTSPGEIAKRLEQIHFNATLNAELEALKYGMMIGATPKLRRLRIGRISAQEEFVGLADESAGNLGWEFLERLRASGAGAVEAWLEETPRGAERERPRAEEWRRRKPGAESEGLSADRRRLLPITLCVIVSHDPRLRRSGDRANLVWSEKSKAAFGDPIDRAAEIAFSQQRPGAVRPARAAGQSARSLEGGSPWPAFDPHQRSMAHLFCLARRRRRSCRNRRLS